ncbi:MAG: 30S ribosomal protein S17 [Actinomycetota bacterium]|nr:30S ribosomal protein S17 [Actinomycetota bacterium]
MSAQQQDVDKVTPQQETQKRAQRKVRTGVVVKDATDKTVVVRVTDQVRHRLYGRIIRRSRKFIAHDETNEAHVGDTVRITETRPLSKTKRWRLVEVVERAR